MSQPVRKEAETLLAHNPEEIRRHCRAIKSEFGSINAEIRSHIRNVNEWMSMDDIDLLALLSGVSKAEVIPHLS